MLYLFSNLTQNILYLFSMLDYPYTTIIYKDKKYEYFIRN